MRSVAASDSRRADPIEFSSYCAITLIRVGFEKIANPLGRNQLRQASFIQGDPGSGLCVFRCELAKHLSLLHESAHAPLIHGNDYAFVWTANRKQVLLRIFQIGLQGADAHF